MYVTPEDYTGSMIPADEVQKALEKATQHIDNLTFNRIKGYGFENLTLFQQEIIEECTVALAEFEYENADMINCVLQQYSINGVSMSFGNSWNLLVQSGVAIPRDIYNTLMQTGLCCRSLGV